MTDNLKAQDRLKTMRAVKGKGTRLELRVCLTLVRMGLNGWRRNAEDLPGKPDIVFEEKHIAIFVDGCFWHGCPYCKRKLPDTNRQYWERKIRRNIELAAIHNQTLANDGWLVLRFWEHDIRDSVGRQEIKRAVMNAFIQRKNNS